MKSKFLIGAVAAIAVGVFAVALLTRPGPADTAPAAATSNAATPQPALAAQKNAYTMAVVASHNSGSSCWTAINGKVYDVTGWINQHPGGPERILSLCGTDGSSAFDAQHGGQSRPEKELAAFYIGDLAR